jgi:hypothetical protein
VVGSKRIQRCFQNHPVRRLCFAVDLYFPGHIIARKCSLLRHISMLSFCGFSLGGALDIVSDGSRAIFEEPERHTLFTSIIVDTGVSREDLRFEYRAVNRTLCVYCTVLHLLSFHDTSKPARLVSEDRTLM